MQTPPPAEIALWIVFLWVILGVILGALAMFFYIHQKQKKQATDMIAQAETEAKEIIGRAEKSASITKKTLDEEREDLKDRKKQFSEQEKRLEEKEKKVDEKYETLERKRNELDQKEKNLENEKQDLYVKSNSLQKRIEEIAQLSEEDARAELLRITEEKYEKDILQRIEKKKKDYTTRSGEIAREILINAVQQYA